MKMQAANPPIQSVLQKFYGGRTFDVVFGVIPAVLLGFYCLILGIAFLVAVFQRYNDIGITLFFLALSLLGFAGVGSCSALIVSMFRRPSLTSMARNFCTVLLCLGIGAAVLALVLLLSGLNLRADDVFSWWYFGTLLFLTISIILSAIKQIVLLRK